jgi:hypothetical protein
VKRSKISINGQLLSEVRTRAIPDYPTRSITFMGHPDVFVREDGDGLLIELNPMSLAQLYYDGVLPQDRSIPVEVKIGRKKPCPWRIDTLVTQRGRWGHDILVLRLVPA